MSYHIGVFGYGPNPSAAILENGVLVAFVEEERYNRIKMAPNSLPVGALMYCLKEAGIGIDDVECIGFGWDCDRYVAEMPGFHSKYRADYPTASNEYNVLQDEFMLNLYDPKRIRTDFQQALALQPDNPEGHYNLGNAMLSLASLSFLGLGAQPPQAEWGAMVSSSRAHFQTHPWQMVAPGLLITIATLSVNALGDALRDAIDPRT